MSDLQHYISKKKANDPAFAENYEAGYAEFKIGAMLQTLRKEAGLTQEDIANKLKTKKSAISRIENHAEDIRLSTLFKMAAIFGKHIKVMFV